MRGAQPVEREARGGPSVSPQFPDGVEGSQAGGLGSAPRGQDKRKQPQDVPGEVHFGKQEEFLH